MQPLSGARLAAAFDRTEPYTIGLEEEVMLLDPRTLAPIACAAELVQRLGDGAFKLELPASQVEIATGVHRDVASALRELAAGRARLAEAAEGTARPAVAGVPPLGPFEGQLNDAPRYERTAAEYGPIARAQLVCALQVHVAIGDADRTLAVYNALRAHLPALAALAANASVYAGRVTELASVRPKISTLLPRQGLPPALESWDALAGELAWGAAAGAVPDAGTWWWELRPHPSFGTLELRVPDAQTTIADAGGGRRRLPRPRRRARRGRRPRPRRAGLADRGEPLVGLPVRDRGHARRPRHRGAAPGARAAARPARPPRARGGAA